MPIVNDLTPTGPEWVSSEDLNVEDYIKYYVYACQDLIIGIDDGEHVWYNVGKYMGQDWVALEKASKILSTIDFDKYQTNRIKSIRRWTEGRFLGNVAHEKSISLVPDYLVKNE